MQYKGKNTIGIKLTKANAQYSVMRIINRDSYMKSVLLILEYEKLRPDSFFNTELHNQTLSKHPLVSIANTSDIVKGKQVAQAEA